MANCTAHQRRSTRNAAFSAAGLPRPSGLSQLAWFDEEFRENDPEVRALMAKGRDYTLDDQALMGRKQT